VWKGAHGVSLAITEGHQAESGLVSVGPVAEVWPVASVPFGSVQGRRGALSSGRVPGSGAGLGGLVAWGGAWSRGLEHRQWLDNCSCLPKVQQVGMNEHSYWKN
jgi:hypothetical protein